MGPRDDRPEDGPDDEDPTRAPLPPPFPVGAVVRYDGTRRVHHATAGREPILEPGMIVRIERAEPGTRGTGRRIPTGLVEGDEEGDGEEGEEGDDEAWAVDRTRDGRSVYRTARGSARAIWAGDEAWTLLSTPDGETDRRARSNATPASVPDAPHRVGDVVVSCSSFFGLVFEAGARRLSVVWESGQVTRHSQGYRGFQWATTQSWHGDAAYEVRTRETLAQELRKVRADRGVASHGTHPLRRRQMSEPRSSLRRARGSKKLSHGGSTNDER